MSLPSEKLPPEPQSVPFAVVPRTGLPDPLEAGIRLPTRFIRLWDVITATVDVRACALMAFCGGWLVFTQIHCTLGAFDRDIKPRIADWNPYLKPIFAHLYWFLCGPIVLFLIPLLLGCWLLKVKPADLGAGLGNWRSGLKWTLGIFAGFLPVVITVSFFDAFKRTYPMNGWAGTEAVNYFTGKGGSVLPILIYELAYGLYFIGWEFFFRGFMGFGLFRTLGWYSVLVATIPFAVMHVGKPEPEALGSVVAGIALGIFALKERSFLYGALLHMLVAWSMDILAITHKVRDALGK
ncbi:MAG: CPBP family glutamic-type intramembrane protease [Myxococcota bacterium]